MTIREFIEKHTFEEKMFAATALSGDNTFLGFKEGDMDKEQMERLMRLLATHVVTNGHHGMKLAILTGKAIKSSIENPIKPKTGLVQRIKGKIKGWLQ